MVAATDKPKFDIREHIDNLTPAKGKNRYICPVCEGNNLTIDPKDGAYKCWSGNCESKDIREAVSPWDGTKSSKRSNNHRQESKPPVPAPVPEGSVELALLPEPVNHPEKRKRGNRTEIEYPYSDTQWVLRTEKPNPEEQKGYEKITIPYHLGEKGEPINNKGDAAWNPYRIDEVEAYGTGKWVMPVEGEPCVEVARSLSVVSFTLQGSEWTEGSLTRAMLQCKSAGVTGVVYFPDHDDTGYKKAQSMAEAAAKAQLPFILLDPTLVWSECPQKGDIADWVKWGMEQGWDKEEFVRRLEEQFIAAVERERIQQDIANNSWDNTSGNIPNSFSPFIEEESTEPNHWNAPVSWKGEIGWLVPVEKPVMETDPETGEETPVIDDNGKPVTETVMVFYPKCNFDFQVEQELSSVDREDGGGLVLHVKRSIDSEQKRVIIKSVDYGSAKDFETALKKALGDGIVVNLKSDQLKSLIHVRLREYRERGGRKYRLCDRIGQQEDGTWVFENKQFTKDGQPTTQEESGWVYNPQVSPTDAFTSPEILDDHTPALRNLIEAQKKVAGSNFMRFLLCDGYVAACLNEQTVVGQEGFMPILNPYGDPGGGKTVGISSALSLVWGTSDKSGMCSASESYLYERLRRYGSIPSLWDDPPSKRREDKEKLDELIKRNYGKFARKVRGSDQHPHSSFIPTTNHATGDTLPATKSRGINLFFPVTGDLKFEYQPELEDAKRRATGAFRQVISIGYNRTLVREVRARLQKHLPTAHDRAAIHLAILTWYTQKLVDLAGMGIDVEAWVIQNLCPELNEAQTGLNSIADFVERFIAAKSTSAIGAWNFGLVRTAEQGNCLAIHMPSVWSVIESGDPPPYNRSVLERVLVEKGAIKNKPAKLERDRDSTLAYQREIHKGRNEGDGWVPPTKPKPVNKKCLLIPERLWGDLGFVPLAPDSDDDEGLVTSGNLEVTSSNLEEVTSYNLDESSISAHLSSSSNLVTKKYIEEKKLVESREAQNTQQPQWDEFSSEPLQKLVTGLPESVDEPRSIENTEVESVTNEGYLEVTEGVKEVTSEAIAVLPPTENPPQGTEAPANVEIPATVVENAPDATEAPTNVETPQTPVIEYRELIVRTDEELQRLGWTNIKGRDHLIATYKKRSRQLLTDAELLDFLQYLEKQPNPSLVSETPPATEEDAQQPLADITDSGNVEAPATEEEWQVGQRITVEADGRVHQEFNDCQGIIKTVNLGSCLVQFDSGESVCILFRCLRRVETACVNPSNGVV